MISYDTILNPNKILTCIVSDMDGTLLPKSFKLSDQTIAAFGRARELGIITILASGRSSASIRPFWNQIGGGFPYIASNGAQIISGDGGVIMEHTIDVALAHEIIEFLRKENVYRQTYYDEAFYHESLNNPMPKHYENSTGLVGHFVPDLIKLIDKPVVKLLGIDSPERVLSFVEILSKKYAGRLNITISDPHFLEIAPIGATKGNALKYLARHMGFKLKYTLALGDSLNDLSMLEIAGMSCAVGSCNSAVIKAATWNSGECESNGAAILIETLLDNGFRPIPKTPAEKNLKVQQ